MGSRTVEKRELQGLKEGEVVGIEKGKTKGLSEGKRLGFVAGREFAEKQAAKLSKPPIPERILVDVGTDSPVVELAPPPPPSSAPLHAATQTDASPSAVVPSIVPGPPLSWADESYHIYAPDPTPDCCRYLRLYKLSRVLRSMGWAREGERPYEDATRALLYCGSLDKVFKILRIMSPTAKVHSRANHPADAGYALPDDDTRPACLSPPLSDPLRSDTAGSSALWRVHSHSVRLQRGKDVSRSIPGPNHRSHTLEGPRNVLSKARLMFSTAHLISISQTPGRYHPQRRIPGEMGEKPNSGKFGGVRKYSAIG
ncbi:hypothetical protein B0H14DRAFT_2631757 [Mycena olivaceomarginata]|nr:hypothetical protein B0H14DRAFT_2631757 [Mycena olivaceomarginata]